MEMMDARKLTIEQAYRAMFYFFEHEYEMTNSSELGGMLGSLSWKTWLKKGPADPAAWDDWKDAVKKALTIHGNIASGEEVISEQQLTIKQAYHAMFCFLEHEYELVNSDEIAVMIDSFSLGNGENAGPADPLIWKNWQNAVEKAFSIQEDASPDDE
jgi:hypothetical protein